MISPSNISIFSININSLKFKQNQIVEFLHDYNPSILLIQECNLSFDEFAKMSGLFIKCGYRCISPTCTDTIINIMTLIKNSICISNPIVQHIVGNNRLIHISIKFTESTLNVINIYGDASGDSTTTKIFIMIWRNS